jgi:polyphenol oxidase
MALAAAIEPAWRAPAGVRAMVTTRALGELSSIRRVLPELPAEPRWLTQVHGIGVADLDALPADAPTPVADASFTTLPGTVCVVRTADCLPVLLAAADSRGVAAAHAGWRGLAAGVIEATVQALRARVGPDVRLCAWLGPAISPRHFEVGDEVREAFMASDPLAGLAFQRGQGDRWMADLYLIARQRLLALGIDDIAGGESCTYADEARFHSHRRDVQHRRLDATGRMASLVWLEA